jgi:hypothetical protein
MDHQPFETWLMSEERLTTEQESSLQAHLQNCPRCQNLEKAWSQVESFLVEKPVVLPAEGFTRRWQARLMISQIAQQAQQAQHERRTAWIFICATLSLAVVLLVFMAIRTLNSFDSPAGLLVSGLTLFAGLTASITVLQDFGVILLNFLSGFLPPAWWLGLFAIISLLCVLWVESLRRLVLSRRIVG